MDKLLKSLNMCIVTLIQFLEKKINSSKPQLHGFLIVEEKAEEKQSPFKADLEDPRLGGVGKE